MGSLANVTLLLRSLTLLARRTTAYLTRLHIRTVAQLSLLVLEVSIVCRIRAGGKVIVRANNIIVGRGYVRVQP